MGRKVLFVAEESANGFAIGEYVPEDCVRITSFEKFMEGSSNGLAQEAIVW